MTGRTLAIGDVHGCHTALTALLSRADISPGDTVVFVGDIVDRGPSTKQVVDELLGLRDICRVVLIMGNHEEMMRGAPTDRELFDIWLRAGGQATLESYGGHFADVPPDHLRFLGSAQPYFETDTCIFIHASLESDRPLEDQTPEFLRWRRLTGFERPHNSGKRVICGHTPQRGGLPLLLDGWVCIDTFVHGGQWLTCLDVGASHVLQASREGRTREFPLR